METLQIGQNELAPDVAEVTAEQLALTAARQQALRQAQFRNMTSQVEVPRTPYFALSPR